MDNDNTVKHKTLIMIQVVSMQAWIKNNPNPKVNKENVEKACINIHAWILNHKNPTTEEELKKIRELKGSLNDSIVNYCVLLSEEKANEIRSFNRKISEHVFYFCESITEFGWVKIKKIIKTKVQEHNEHLERTQFPEGGGN
jgi:hypothetical protein